MTLGVRTWQALEEIATDVICIVLSSFGSENVHVCASTSCLPHRAACGLDLSNLIPHTRVLLSREIRRGRDILALLGLSGWNVTQQGENSKC